MKKEVYDFLNRQFLNDFKEGNFRFRFIRKGAEVPKA